MAREDRKAAALATEALAHHRSGALDEADRLYRQALALHPDEPDALHGLGALALGRGQSGRAIALIGRAIRVRPEAALYYVNLGRALHEQGHLEEARAALQVAVLRGPDDARAHFGLATTLESLQRHADAKAAAAQAVRLDPAAGTPSVLVPGANALLARLHLVDDETEPAIRHLRAAAAEAPDDATAWHALGAALGHLGHLAEAEAAFRRTAELVPDDPAALANLGGVLFELNRLDEALAALQRAAAGGQATAATRSNLGLVLMALGHLTQAEHELAGAAALAPDADGILINHGSVLTELGRHDEAEACLQLVETRTAEPSIDRSRARFNRATVLLATGRAAEGWAAFEARRVLIPPPPIELPDWDGGPLPAGTTLLLHAEQGLGDAIQFLRYVPIAASRAPVRLVLPDALRRLAACLASSRCTIAGLADPLPPECVARASLLSLPHILRLAGAPPPAPYLTAPAPPPGLELRGDGRLAIGLCWAGSPGYRFDRRRSLRLEQLAPLAGLPGLAFVSLQQGEAARQPAPPGLDLLDPPSPLHDLADTACLIAQLDLVVSVDTAIAHLAGALSRPVWLLNRYGGDWRWQPGHQDEAGRSLWYPSLRQFRQPVLLPPEQAWSPTIAALAAALLELDRS